MLPCFGKAALRAFDGGQQLRRPSVMKLVNVTPPGRLIDLRHAIRSTD